MARTAQLLVTRPQRGRGSWADTLGDEKSRSGLSALPFAAGRWTRVDRLDKINPAAPRSGDTTLHPAVDGRPRPTWPGLLADPGKCIRMVELNRRHLLLGATSLAGAAAVPVLSATPALAGTPQFREVILYGTPGGDTLTTYNDGRGKFSATYSNRSAGITAQALLKIPYDTVSYYTNFPGRGRMLQTDPVDPRVGIFGQATNREQYRVAVAGYGIVVFNGAQQRIRFQVMGANGRRHWGEYARWNNPGEIQAVINTFVDQTNTLNQQYRAFWNLAAQYGVGFVPGAVAGIAGIIVAGANPLTIIGLIAAAATVGNNLIFNLVNAYNQYLTTMNQLIETFNRIAVAIGLPAPDIALYNVGGVRYNMAQVRYLPRPTFTPINTP